LWQRWCGISRSEFSKGQPAGQYRGPRNFGSPIIYFTSSRYTTYSSTYSLKKAVFSPKGDWEIYDILDYPSSAAGISSLDGRYPAFVMNDYSLPGWGPTSPFSGSGNLVTRVSNTAINPEKNSFRLVGTGPSGLSTIVDYCRAQGWSTVEVAGRTCLHMNPKLFDFDSKAFRDPCWLICFINRPSEKKRLAICQMDQLSKSRLLRLPLP